MHMSSRDLDAAGITDPMMRKSYERCRELNAQYGKTEELKRVSQDVLSNLFQLPGAKRDELVRRAAAKFKQGLRNRQSEFGSAAQNDSKAKSKNKRATAAEIIFAAGGNDDDSSDDDNG